MTAIETYLATATIRRFEERCAALEREGPIEGSMHLCGGQEAISRSARVRRDQPPSLVEATTESIAAARRVVAF